MKALLTMAQADQIRKKYGPRKWTVKGLAFHFKMAPSMVKGILEGRSYAPGIYKNTHTKIRELYQNQPPTIEAIAKEYDVPRRCIENLLRGATYLGKKRGHKITHRVYKMDRTV